MEKPLGHYCEIASPDSVTRKQIFLYPHGDILGLRKPKRIITNTNRSYHQRASSRFSLNRFNDSDLVLTNPVGKDKVQGSQM